MPAVRACYRPSGRFHLVRTFLLLAAGIVLALFLAALLAIAGENGLYFLIITPVVLALPLPALAYSGSRWARFRSRYLGAVLGVMLGCLFYVGRYYLLLVYLAGPAMAPHIEVLPRFIAFCVNNQVVLNDGPAIANKQSAAMNWLLFATELSLCSAMPAAAWYAASLKPFCERCGTWMSVKNTVVPAGSAHSLADALNAGDLDSLEAAPEIEGGLPSLFSRIQIVGCTHGGEDQAATFFLAASEVHFEGDKSTDKVVLHRVALSPEEFLTVAEKFPGLMT